MIKKSDNIFRVLILILMLLTCSKLLIAGNQHPTIRGIVNSAKYEKHGILILDRDSKNANIGFAPVPLIYYEQKYDLIIEDSEILVPVIIATKGDYIDFENCGISINSKINDLVTATLNLDQLACLEKNPNILQIELASKLWPLLDSSIETMGVDEVRDSFNFDGSGIIVGIVDQEIDLQNKDFLDNNNQTRLLFLWDQFDNTGNPPCYNYGTEWTKSKIDSGLCGNIGGIFHGSHVAGIASGNGRQTARGIPLGTFSGVAPNADIIFINTTGYGNNVIDALEYIGLKADSIGKPWVANLSMGAFRGPRDGTSLFEQDISYIANQDLGKGGIIVVAAGNENYAQCKKSFYRNHAHQQDSSAVVIELSASLSDTLDQLSLEIWYDEMDCFRVSVMAPSGHIYGPFEPDSGTGPPGYGMYLLPVDSSDGLVCIHNDHWGPSQTNPHPYTPDKQIIIDILDIFVDSAWHHVRSGDWMVTLSGDLGEWDLYLNSTRDSNNTGIASWGHDNIGKITEPGNAYDIITVGALNSKRIWTDVNGNMWQSPCINSWELGDTSYFSSRGPTRDGRDKPEILAPGALIGSSIPSSFYSDLNFDNKLLLYDSTHYLKHGTSMAAPHITGLVALMLQKNPDLSFSEILNCLQSTSINGKVDAFEAIKCIPDPLCQGICGDANNDGDVSISDAVWLINYVFVPNSSPPQPRLACGDASPNQGVNVSDAVWIINFVFASGSPPGDCHPGSWAGQGGDCCPYTP